MWRLTSETRLEQTDLTQAAAVPGFSRLGTAHRMAAVARKALFEWGSPWRPPPDTPIVYAGSNWDAKVARRVADSSNGRVSPLLLQESVPNSILGIIAHEFTFTGAVLTVSVDDLHCKDVIEGVLTSNTYADTGPAEAMVLLDGGDQVLRSLAQRWSFEE